MVKDHFASQSAGLTAPAQRLVAVTPDDATDFAEGLSRGLFVGGAGSVSVQDAHGNIADLESSAGQYHPIRVIRVRSTGTTATGLVALY